MKLHEQISLFGREDGLRGISGWVELKDWLCLEQLQRFGEGRV